MLVVQVVKAVRAPVAPAYLRAVLARAASVREVAARLPASATLTVRVTGDREVRRLNLEFLGEDHATDVLSFPSGDVSDGYLGDIALAWPAVVRQADSFGHPPEVEAALLAIHGFLHLLGWDDDSEWEAGEMNRLCLTALAAAGIRPADGRI